MREVGGGKFEVILLFMSKSGGFRESLCYGCGERGYFCWECFLDNRCRLDGGVGGVERYFLFN